MKIFKSQLKSGQPVTTFFALASVQLKKSKIGKYYLTLGLRDKSGSITGYVWDNAQEVADTLSKGSFVKVRGIPKMVNNALCLYIDKIRVVEWSEVDMTDFLIVVPGGIALWETRLRETVELVIDRDCRRLIDGFLGDEEFMRLFLAAPGGMSIHHPYVGGLLEHTVSVMKDAAALADQHQALLSKSVLITGAFLHDIGKVEEIQGDITREYTTRGKLLGHFAIGLELLDRKIASLPDFPAALALHLKHMIVSHHGAPEFGSPVKPATPEAIALHLIDNEDAKINHLYCFLGESNPDEAWSHFDRILGTELYMERRNGRGGHSSTKRAA